ncbi:MAG: hypothetical protein VX619_07060 [bacterium]|nr:hypothetical protein [bacterium]
MSQFQTKPKYRFLIFLPQDGSNKKLLKWINALFDSIIAKHKLHIAGDTEIDYSKFDQYRIKKSATEFCEENNDLIILTPQDFGLTHLHWLNTDKHRLVVYGFEQSNISESIILNICDGILWMDKLPDSIHTTIPVYEITARSKTKWKKFVDHDWWQVKPNKAAVEFCDTKNFFINQINETKKNYESQLESLQATYREEIKAWSEASYKESSQTNGLENTKNSLELQQPSNSVFEKKLHAKEVYIQDLETRLGRYENQTLYVIWHQIKQFFKVVVIRLPLTIFLLGYHIFSTYYHRYKSSNKPL